MCFLLLSLLLLVAEPISAFQDTNGGVGCAACSILVGLVEQLTQLYNESVAESLARFCNYLPAGGFEEACKVLVDEYSPGVISLLEARETPDIVCYGIGFCRHDTATTCHLFPLPAAAADTDLTQQRWKLSSAAKIAEKFRGRPFKAVVKASACTNPVFKPICDIIERFASDHKPLVDIDGDLFSDMDTFRGTSWRGKDCDDLDDKVYPGRRSHNGDEIFDSNCNGIVGVDPDTGKSYEDQWCNGTGQMGVVVLGDSVGAHFHIPPEYLTAKDLSIETFSNLFFYTGE